MTFQEALVRAKKEVEQGLALFFAKKRQEAKKISPHCLMLVDSVAEFTMRGGKRTRAFLVWAGYQTAVENTPDVKVISHTSGVSLQHAMMGVELFQSFALIHDDIIDEDTVRRGGPTVHAKQGEPMAILAGDLAIAWADELINTPDVKEISHTSGVKSIYQRMKEEVILGQSLDVLAKEGKPSADRVTINRYKTAWYTVIRPLQIGAAIAGADEKTIASFVPYGLVVGEAYQLRDDLLDGAISDEEFQKKAKKLVVPKSATILFTDFARYVLTRQS